MSKNYGFCFLLIMVASFSIFLSKDLQSDSYYYDCYTYSFSRDNVPDLDQVRSSEEGIAGLPNDGEMYCVPAAAMNWMAYIANHGYPAVMPGPGNWEVSPPQYTSEYNFMTFNLLALGLSMNTDPYDGTDVAGPATQAWLDSAAPGQFSIVEAYADGSWAPRVKDAGIYSVFGGLVNLNIAWYSEMPLTESIQWVGGHMVTLVSAYGMLHQLSVNDPYTQSMFSLNPGTTQSPFKENFSGFEGVQASFCYYDNGFICSTRTQDKLDYMDSAYVQGFIAVIPKYGLVYSSDELIILNPKIISGMEREQIKHIHPFPGKKILDAEINPLRIQHPFIVEGSNTIWMLDSLLGTSTEFATVENPQRLIYGGKRDHLYVLSKDKITKLDREGHAEKVVNLEFALDEIAFDEKNQQLIGVSRESQQMLVFDPSLELEKKYSIGREVLGDEGNLAVSINPTTGEIGIFAQGNSYYTVVTIDEAGNLQQRQIDFPAEIESAEAFYLDEYGTAFVSDRGVVVPFDRNGKIAEESPFYRLPGGEGIMIHRSFSNFDPATMPRMKNLTPEQAARLVHQ